MNARLFSDRDRPVHLGPYPLERLTRTATLPDLTQVPAMPVVPVTDAGDPTSIVNATGEYQSMLDAIRRGMVATARSQLPDDLQERSDHLKAFGHFCDATMVGIAALPDAARLDDPRVNPGIATLAETLRTRQTRTLAAGIDLIMADLKESMDAPPVGIAEHSHAIVLLYAFPRDPSIDEPGTQWLVDMPVRTLQLVRASLRASESASVLANYLRTLGHDARAHAYTATDVCLHRLAVAAGLAHAGDARAEAPDNPYVGTRYALAAITTTLPLAADQPLAPLDAQRRSASHGAGWWLGKGTRFSRFSQDPFAKRRWVDGAYPFETLKRIDEPTTYIDEANVARVPKRTDMFARAQFGDMGRKVQEAAKGGRYVRQAAPSAAQRRTLGALLPIQDGPVAATQATGTDDPARMAAALKATAYFLGADAVGLSRCPDWAYYSHDARGEAIVPRHGHAISIIVDQGHETMEGASGDDWISVAQSMRAYLRFSLIGGVLARHIRNLGFDARSHTVLDGEVLQPPLLLLAGLGEVSRIGEVILNPFLGPRLKSGVVTTTLPMQHDRPIDFGLQRFCEGCNKCARECPSGAITAGPKRMFNGYEIWKSDSQKCSTYRMTTEGGAMCGRCMKTCPWNLEGLFSEVPFRWTAMHFPTLAPWLARLDDAANRGSINPVKKWWWDLEEQPDGSYSPTDKPVNVRTLQKELTLRYEDQTLAVYPAHLAPPPWPYPFPMDREKGIAAYVSMVSAEEYRALAGRGELADVAHRYSGDRVAPGEQPPVMQVEVTLAESLGENVVRYGFHRVDGQALPAWEAGAHIDVVVAPEYLRQYSLTGNPAEPDRYEIGVLREDAGRGGSALLHRVFAPGRKLFISRPVNHFALEESAGSSLLFGGGIGVTPMIGMAWRLHALQRPFHLHYSVRDRAAAAYASILQAAPWSDRVTLHISQEGSRLDPGRVLADADPGTHVYTCGPDAYMQAVMSAAEQAGLPDSQRHLEYFAVPEEPDYVNERFTLRIAASGEQLEVPADRTAADVLLEAGHHVDVKCADGLCGTCRCTLIAGEVEHRDHVLSSEQRRSAIILCQSRASQAGGVLEIAL